MEKPATGHFWICHSERFDEDNRHYPINDPTSILPNNEEAETSFVPRIPHPLSEERIGQCLEKRFMPCV